MAKLADVLPLRRGASSPLLPNNVTQPGRIVRRESRSASRCFQWQRHLPHLAARLGAAAAEESGRRATHRALIASQVRLWPASGRACPAEPTGRAEGLSHNPPLEAAQSIFRRGSLPAGGTLNGFRASYWRERGKTTLANSNKRQRRALLRVRKKKKTR